MLLKVHKIRQRYGLTERDDATGLDHTWWRKYENRAGPLDLGRSYLGTMAIADPQSFNRYTYIQNDPVNFVDPTGLVQDPPPDGIERINTWDFPWPRGGAGGGGRYLPLQDVDNVNNRGGVIEILRRARERRRECEKGKENGSINLKRTKH